MMIVREHTTTTTTTVAGADAERAAGTEVEAPRQLLEEIQQGSARQALHREGMSVCLPACHVGFVGDSRLFLLSRSLRRTLIATYFIN